MTEANHFLPGGFYSPIPDFEDIIKNKDKYFNFQNEALDIDFNTEKQDNIYSHLKPYMLNFLEDNKNTELLYNGYFSSHDVLFLTSILQHYKTNKIIEIGSGYSTHFTKIVKDKYSENLEITCIEPYPDRLYSLIDKGEINVIEDNIQNVDINIFKSLQENDVLFIDTSHVSKIGSDVNHLIFNILPILNKGVIVHFHDCNYLFEYPSSFYIEHRRSWNECYLIRALLQNNDVFKILIQYSYLKYIKKDYLINLDINCGSSIWIRKEKQ